MIKLLYLDPQTPIFPIILEAKVAGMHVLVEKDVLFNRSDCRFLSSPLSSDTKTIDLVSNSLDFKAINSLL